MMNPTTAPRSSSALDDSRVVRAMESYTAALQRGERPDRAALVADLPADVAEALAGCLEGLELVHAARPALSGSDGSLPLPNGTIPAQPLGDFQLLREIGRGGMGVVYEAIQLSLGRRVALKILPFAATMDPRQLQRFRHEAQAAAMLHHPNVVPVFGVGCERGVHYYAMQLIPGQSLAAMIDELRGPRPSSGGGGTESHQTQSFHPVHRSIVSSVPSGAENQKVPMSPVAPVSKIPNGAADTAPVAALNTQPTRRDKTHYRHIAELIAQAADALEYAHTMGVVHRDIKPANLMLDEAGHLWVTDFGLAKLDAAVGMTVSGDLLGTLRYMSPEQALAKHGLVDHRTDVYSLGATLYELLTLRPAMDGADKQEILRKIAFEEPRAPRTVDRAIPAELETITLKALAKEPAERYATAGDLADDLRKFLADEPIRARRVTPWEHGWRWCRRHPAVASLTAVVALLLFAVTVASILAATHFERIAGSEREARQGQNRTLTDMYTAFGVLAGGRDEPRQAILWFANAARMAGDDRERADANRTRAAAWGRQAIQPVRAFVHPADWIENNMVFHPGGRHLLTHGYDLAADATDCRLWDVERETAVPFPGNPDVVSAAAWDATGERLAVGTPQGEVTIYRFSSGELLQRVDFADRITRVLFSPDGRYCAVAAARQVRVLDCRQAAFATPELEHPKQITTLAFHPQGELLATGCKDNYCRVFAVPGGTPLIAPVRHLVGIRDNGVSPPRPCSLRKDAHSSRARR